MVNAIGRLLPEHLEGYGGLVPFTGAFSGRVPARRHAPPVKSVRPGERKVVEGLDALFDRIPIGHGMTLSFHHHFRNGDRVLNLVLATAAKRGIKGLKVAPSALFPVHAPLIEHVRRGVVADLDTNYMAGPVARAVSEGLFPRPVVLRTHGGRARAIECGELKIDVAFIAAPAADDYGNINGVTGPSACGSLGYALPDAEYADFVVAVTDHLVEYPLAPVSIPQTRVDWVARVEAAGDPSGIVSGTTRITGDGVQLKIARAAAEVIEAAGLIRDGLSFQTGAGGASLATAHFLGGFMDRAGVSGSFGLGGVTGQMVAMLEQGLVRKILDVQGFDLEAVRSLAANPGHLEIGSSFYANPFNCGCAVNRLDCAVLGATEIDTDFNVNVVSGSDGIILGGSGGHSDAAAGAGLTVIVASLVRGRLPIVRDRVLTATTPGETVDVLVTEHGVAVNPRRADILSRLKDAGLATTDIHTLKALAERLAAVPAPLDLGEKIVAVVEYRDGTVIDVLRQTRNASRTE
jgi:citrate lyase subunit alpha/citrate CoA-transferase